jgi:predicted CopG family antitoxin
MKRIKIDDEVYTYLQQKAIAFEEDPNDVLRRIFDLNQVNAPQKPSPEHIKHPRKPHKQPITNLKDLVSDGVLSEGQRLIFQHSGKRLPEFTATISGKQLIWKGNRYSMSALAGMALETIGLKGDSVCGPLFWFTEEGKSISDIWKQYIRKQGKVS